MPLLMGEQRDRDIVLARRAGAAIGIGAAFVERRCTATVLARRHHPVLTTIPRRRA